MNNIPRIGFIETVVIVYQDNLPLACGCFIVHNSDIVEIKRVFVHHDYRAKGYSKVLINELEQWAKETGHNTSILETGKKQPEAIALYRKLGYQLTENFGPYKNVQKSFCFSKKLT